MQCDSCALCVILYSSIASVPVPCCTTVHTSLLCILHCYFCQPVHVLLFATYCYCLTDASLNQTSQAPIIVDPDTRDTSTVQPNMRETTTVELVTKETTVTRAPRDSTHTILVEEGNTAHTTSIEQQYSPEISMADGSLPKQFNTLQPSR